jgi:hypothetical protein
MLILIYLNQFFEFCFRPTITYQSRFVDLFYEAWLHILKSLLDNYPRAGVIYNTQTPNQGFLGSN